MNSVNYLKHSLYTPKTYHRRFELDLPEENNETGLENQAKRIGLIALPFLSLVKPLANPLSIGMGCVRVFTHLNGAITAENLQNWKDFSTGIVQVAISVFTVASTILNFTLGLLISTGMDLLQGLIRLVQFLSVGEYKKAVEEALQVLGQVAYLAFMVYGALEIMVLFSILQTAISFFQAQGDFAKGRYLEAIAKFGMGCVRLSQAKGYVHQIERRNQLCAMQKYADFIRRSLKGREVRYLLENPLSEYKDKIGQVNEEFDTGAHFHGHGNELVKGANLTFRTKIVDGKEITELDFKVNHLFREKIQDTIDDFSKLDPVKMKEILEIMGSHASGIKIEHGIDFPLGNGTMGTSTKITVDGLGSIFVGASSKESVFGLFEIDKTLPTMYDRVVVQMDADKNLYDFHELMTFLDVDQSLHVSTKEDLDRLKMGHLFRIFCPREATPFERTEEFFKLPLDELKAKIIEQAPEMESAFKEYFDRMTPREIIDGRIRYQVEGLAEKAYEHGARALTAVLTGAYNDKALYDRVTSMLKIGMISSEMRAKANMGVVGLSPDIDFISGGADSVFTQMITEKDCKEGKEFDELFYYHGKVRFLISLDALETGTYQSFEGNCGNRRISEDDWMWGGSYAERPNILEFTDQLQNNNDYAGHEVMLKERVDPSFFTGLVVSDASFRDGLMNHLRSNDLVQINQAGQETILGIAADKFITVRNKVSEELFAHCS